MGYPTGSIQVTGPIGTTASTDTYPTHWDFLGFGGARSVDTLTDRNAISALRRVFGMKVEVTADADINNNGTYILADGTNGGVDSNVSNNANWIFYNGNYGAPVYLTIDVALPFTRDGVFEILLLSSDKDVTLLFGTTPGGSEIAFCELSAGVKQTLRLDYPIDSTVTIYVSGITSAGAAITGKAWIKY